MTAEEKKTPMPREMLSACGCCGHPWWRAVWDREEKQHSRTLGECKACGQVFLLSDLPPDDD